MTEEQIIVMLLHYHLGLSQLVLSLLHHVVGLFAAPPDSTRDSKELRRYEVDIFLPTEQKYFSENGRKLHSARETIKFDENRTSYFLPRY